MTVAVVIPVFNGARHLRITLESVLAQERAPDRIIVVDDQSSDESAAIARSVAGVEVVANPDKGGPTARNLGAHIAGTDVIAILDQDDIWHPTHLRLVLAELAADPGRVCAFGGVLPFHDAEDPHLGSTPAGVTVVDPWHRFPTHCPIGTPSGAVIRRAAYDEVGGFEQRFEGVGDYVLWLQLGLLGSMVRLDAMTVGKREHPHSQTRELQRDGPALLDLHLRATASALEARVATGDDARRWAKRQAVAVASAGLALAALRDASAEEVAAFDTSALEDAERDDLWDAFRLLTRTLVGGQGAEVRLDLMSRLYRVWPRELSSRRWLLEYCARRHWPAGRFFSSLARLDGRRAGFLTRLLALKWKREFRSAR